MISAEGERVVGLGQPKFSPNSHLNESAATIEITGNWIKEDGCYWSSQCGGAATRGAVVVGGLKAARTS